MKRYNGYFGKTHFGGLLVGAAIICLSAAPALAQTVSCGSTGVDGAFSPTASTTLTLPPSGVFNFTTVNIPNGVTVTFTKNAANTPVTILATGDVTIGGAIDVSGKSAGTSGIPGRGGPGGFDGGMGGNVTVSLNGTSGLGPGGGGGGDSTVPQGSGGGFGTAGGGVRGGPTYGVPTLIPLIGGSGGGGAVGSATIPGGGGGGGGGAILICSPGTISLSGGFSTIRANGGGGATVGNAFGSGGSGGGIRLIANRIAGTGTIGAIGGFGGFASPAGGSGRIRLEAFDIAFTGGATPAPSSGLPGPVTPPTGFPTLKITTVAGVTAPDNPQGSFLATPDITLSPLVTNPVTVNLAAANIPLQTNVAVTVTPEAGTRTTVNSTPLSGTLSSSTASASVTLPNGTSIISATATFATSSTAGLGTPMMIGGEEVERIRVATTYGGGSTVTYITASGREVPLR